MFWNIVNFFDLLIEVEYTYNPIYIKNKFRIVNKNKVEIFVDKKFYDNRIEYYITKSDNHNLYKGNIMCICD